MKAIWIAGLAMTALTTSALAESNFSAGNKGDGTYVPRAERYAKPADANKAPGFWAKEWERSGFSQVGDRMADGTSLNPFTRVKEALAKEEKEYKERKGVAA